MSNVSSVDLDELRKAREELNQEIGVENDPNMYKDYNPNREEEKKKEPEIEPVVEEQTSREPVSGNLESIEEKATSETSDANFSDEETKNAEPENELPSKSEVLDMLLDDSDPEPDIKTETPSSDESSVENEVPKEETHSSSEQNLGKFDMFAAFEVKENAVPKSSNSELETIINNETTTERTTNLENIEKELEADNLGEKSEEVSEPVETNAISKFETIDNLEDLENMLNGFLDDLEKDDEVYESNSENVETELSEIVSPLAGVDIEPTFDIPSQESSEESELENLETSVTDDLDNLESEESNPLDEEPEQPYRKDVLGALMNRKTETDIQTETDDEKPVEEQESEESEMNFNANNVGINVDSNLVAAINEPDEDDDANAEISNEVEEETENINQEEVEDKFSAFEVNVDGENSKLDEASEEDAETPEEINSDVSEKISEDSADEQNEESDKETKEEVLDVGVKDIGRILGINEEEQPKKEEFVETTEFFDPSKARKKATVENEAFEEPEIITDYSQLREILQRELKESELAEQEKIDEEIAQELVEEPAIKYPLIEEFKFINEITTDEFKHSNKFSYIMGKNEKGEMVYGNFREHNNLAVFSRNEIVTKSFLNSLILSLCLKNSSYDVNFVLIDSDINSSFEVYNKSSYLFFNRIAKTNKEILDTLIEISKEVDSRYEKLANAGIGSIDQYNEMTEETQTTPMPNIIIVFNNYTDVSQATYADKINACLYQILKFGRIVGIYMVLTAMVPIETNQVNYNLSSRLSFKSDQNSKYTVGVEGVEYLPDEADAIYFNISKNSTEHIKAPTIADSELDLIIKELED